LKIQLNTFILIFILVTPTHIEPEQYTHTQSRAPEDEFNSIRNMLSKK